jgi:hypothetical protein
MTNTRADYAIVEVHYSDGEKKHIQSVRIAEFIGDNIRVRKDPVSREYIVGLLDSGKIIITLYKTVGGDYAEGSPVEILEVDHIKYIRTDKNSEEADNLGELPEF